MFGMFKPRTTIEIRDYGSDSETTTSWGKTTEKGTRKILKITTDDLQRDLPEISRLVASKSVQETKVIKPSEPRTISLLPEVKPKPKSGWF